MIFKEKIKDFSSACPNRYTGRRGEKPDVIVLHNTGGSKISSAHRWFLDPDSQTSAHYLVGLNGEIRQYVDLADTAWCNGTTSDRSKAHFYGNSTNGVVRSRQKNANLYSVSIEFVGHVGSAMTPAQRRTAVLLIDRTVTEIERIYGVRFPLNRLHVISHSEVAPLTRGLCGKGFDIDGIIKDVEALREERRFKKTVAYARSGGKVSVGATACIKD